MKFVATLRNIQSVIWLSVATPLLAQTALPAPDVVQSGETTPQQTVPQIINEPVLTQEPAPVPQPTPKKAKMDSLKPGHFVWEKRDSYEGQLKIVTVLDLQRIYVFLDSKLIGFSTISAGKKGKETPTGIFSILQKNIDHKSNLYSNAPMPYMQRLTWDGIALHGGYIPGYPASHGCIRLPLAFAKALFGITQMNQEVFVLKNLETPVKRSEPNTDSVVDPAVTQPPVSKQQEPIR